MLVRFRQSLIVNNHNHVEGDVAELPDEKATQLIREGAVAREWAVNYDVPGVGVKREAVAVPKKTRKAVQDV